MIIYKLLPSSPYFDCLYSMVAVKTFLARSTRKLRLFCISNFQNDSTTVEWSTHFSRSS